MAHIYQRGKQQWECRVRRKGYPKHILLADLKKENADAGLCSLRGEYMRILMAMDVILQF